MSSPIWQLFIQPFRAYFHRNPRSFAPRIWPLRVPRANPSLPWQSLPRTRSTDHEVPLWEGVVSTSSCQLFNLPTSSTTASRSLLSRAIIPLQGSFSKLKVFSFVLGSKLCLMLPTTSKCGPQKQPKADSTSLGDVKLYQLRKIVWNFTKITT